MSQIKHHSLYPVFQIKIHSVKMSWSCKITVKRWFLIVLLIWKAGERVWPKYQQGGGAEISKMCVRWYVDAPVTTLIQWNLVLSSQGIVVGQQGPSFLDILLITDTNVETGSYFFTAASLGYMFGSFASGYFHGKVSHSVLSHTLSLRISVESKLDMHARCT